MSETLTKVPFGQTDMAITWVGFGAWAIGGGDWAFAWGNQDDDDSVAAIRHAVESRDQLGRHRGRAAPAPAPPAPSNPARPVINR